MAATYGRVQGFNRDDSTTAGEATRRGHSRVWTQAATYRTFAEVNMMADGSYTVLVRRDDKTIGSLIGKAEAS